MWTRVVNFPSILEHIHLHWINVNTFFFFFFFFFGKILPCKCQNYKSHTLSVHRKDKPTPTGQSRRSSVVACWYVLKSDFIVQPCLNVCSWLSNTIWADHCPAETYASLIWTIVKLNWSSLWYSNTTKVWLKFNSFPSSLWRDVTI